MAAPPTKQAEPAPAVEPVKKAVARVASAGTSTETRLSERLSKLAARVARAKAKGVDVALYERQIDKLRERLERAKVLSGEDRDRVTSALDRLEAASDL